MFQQHVSPLHSILTNQVIFQLASHECCTRACLLGSWILTSVLTGVIGDGYARILLLWAYQFC